MTTTITNGYTTLDSIKARLNITDSEDDAALARAVMAASRAIDAATGRRFHTTAADETRYFTHRADDGNSLYPGDMVSITTVATDDTGNGTYTAWSASDYVLAPRNAALDGKPYREIYLAPLGVKSFPAGVRDGVKLVGKFGYAATAPRAVEEACNLIAMRLWKKDDVLFGLGGTDRLGVVRLASQIMADPEIAILLASVIPGDGLVYSI